MNGLKEAGMCVGDRCVCVSWGEEGHTCLKNGFYIV